MTAYYPQAAKYLFREFPGYEENIWRGAMKIYNESSKIWTANNILCSNHDVKQAGHLAFVTSNKFFLINQFTEQYISTIFIKSRALPDRDTSPKIPFVQGQVWLKNEIFAQILRHKRWRKPQKYLFPTLFLFQFDPISQEWTGKHIEAKDWVKSAIAEKLSRVENGQVVSVPYEDFYRFKRSEDPRFKVAGGVGACTIEKTKRKRPLPSG